MEFCVGCFVEGAIAVVEHKVYDDHGEIRDVEVYDIVHGINDLVQDAGDVAYYDHVAEKRTFALGRSGNVGMVDLEGPGESETDKHDYFKNTHIICKFLVDCITVRAQITS